MHLLSDAHQLNCLTVNYIKIRIKYESVNKHTIKSSGNLSELHQKEKSCVGAEKKNVLVGINIVLPSLTGTIMQ